MKNTIKITKKYLVFRDEIKKILENISRTAHQQKNLKNIYLDFSLVEFLSRSFTDELLNTIEKLKNKKMIITLINLKPELRKLTKQVKKTKEKIRKEINL